MQQGKHNSGAGRGSELSRLARIWDAGNRPDQPISIMKALSMVATQTQVGLCRMIIGRWKEKESDTLSLKRELQQMPEPRVLPFGLEQ
jgi:hypothetical protein